MTTPINVASRLAALEARDQVDQERVARLDQERRADRRALWAIAGAVLLSLAGAVFWAGYQNARLDNVESMLREIRAATAADTP